MASTASLLLKLELQSTGEKLNTWGIGLNDAFQRIEEAITGRINIPVTGGSLTLDDTEYQQNQARYAVLEFTGTLSSNQTIIVPSRDKVYIVLNNTDPSAFTLTVKTDAGTGVDVEQGTSRLLLCDSINVQSLLFNELSEDPSPELSASLNANSNEIQSANFVAYTEKLITNNAVTGTYTCDMSQGNIFKLTVIGDTAIYFSNIPTAGVSNVMIYVTQDGTGGHNVTFPAGIRWPEGSSPILTTDAGSTDILIFFSPDGGITIDGKLSNKDTK